MPSSACGIPNSAAAYPLNLTAIASGPLGYLTAWQAGQTLPVAATLNDANGGVVGSAAIVPAGTSGAIDVFASSNTNLVIDINGYSVGRVCTPEDAFALTGTGIDALAIGNCFLRKEVQELRLKRDYAHAFGLAPQWLQHVIM